jgi:hypothetical protein
MTKKASSPELPPNIKEFNEITAVMFSKLYESFPIDRRLDPDEIAAALGLSDRLANLPSGRSFNSVWISTLGLLTREGFVHSYAAVQHERCVLASKAMAIMNVVPPELKQPFASELAEATRDANKIKMAELIGSFLGSFTGSAWKSMGS